MRETDLDQMFAEFEATATPTFRPPGVPATRRRKRNRRRRGLLAGIVALLLAGPAGAYAIAGRDDRIAPLPPAPTVSPSPGMVRQVPLPQGLGRPIDFHFLDARHWWALYDSCAPDTGKPRSYDKECPRTLVRTTDGGATWQTTSPLPLPEDGAGMVYLLPVDARTVTVVDRNRFLVTTDGGATFTTHPIESPPLVTQQSIATSGGFLLRCPGGNLVGSLNYHLVVGLTSATDSRTCDRRQLARTGRRWPPPSPRWIRALTTRSGSSKAATAGSGWPFAGRRPATGVSATRRPVGSSCPPCPALGRAAGLPRRP